MKKKIIAVSGYFNPLHKGHIEMINEAAKLGDVLVIVNNDRQVKLKGSVPFMDENERRFIVGSLKKVRWTVISLDDDRSVCRTLAAMNPDIFANGGDVTDKNIPEKKICKQLGIKLLFGVGGGKVQSSSQLIGNAIKYDKKKK